MKTPRSGPPRRAPGWAVWLGALALGLLALAPAGALRLMDAVQLGRVQAQAEPYTAQQPTGDDFYLLRCLDQLQSEFTSDPTDIAAYVPTRLSEMHTNLSNGIDALQTLRQLAEAGAVPQAWAQDLFDELGVDEDMTPDIQYYESFYCDTDSLGFVTVNFYDAPQPPVKEPLRFSLVYESRTGHVVYVWLRSPKELPAPADPLPCLQAFVRCAGLEALGDWAPPEGTGYAGKGLYSANGQALAGMECGPFTPESGGDTAWGLTIYLSLYQPVRVEDTAGDGNDDHPALQGELRSIYVRNGGAGYQDGDGYYEVMDLPGEGALLVCTDLATGACAPVCCRAGCTHSDAGCQAWLPYGTMIFPFTAGGRLYILHQSYYTAEERQASQPPEEYRRALEEDYTFASTGEARAQEIQHLVELRYAEWEPTWVDVFGPDGSRTRLCDVQDDIFFYFCDDGSLYGRALQGFDPVFGEAGNYSSFVQLCLADGTMNEYPLPADSPMRSSYDDIEAHGQELMLIFEDYHTAMNVSYLFANEDGCAQAYNGRHVYCLAWSPETGAIRQVANIPCDANTSTMYFTPGALFLQQEEGITQRIDRVDLDDGSITPFVELSGHPYTILSPLPAAPGPSGLKDRWFCWGQYLVRAGKVEALGRDYGYNLMPLARGARGAVLWVVYGPNDDLPYRMLATPEQLIAGEKVPMECIEGTGLLER